VGCPGTQSFEIDAKVPFIVFLVFVFFSFFGYRDQHHHSRFNGTKVMRRNPKKSWKLAAIVDFGGHFDFLSDCLTLEPKLFDSLTFKLVLKTKLLHQFEMTECMGTPLFRLLERKGRHIAIPRLVSSSTCHSASAYQISSIWDHHPQRSYDVILVFKMVAAAWKFYCRFRFWSCRTSGNVEGYLHTKLRRDMSIHG